MNTLIINCSRFGLDKPQPIEIMNIDGINFSRPLLRRSGEILPTQEETIVINKTILRVGYSLNYIHEHEKYINIAGYKYKLLVTYDIELNIIETFIILMEHETRNVLLPFQVINEKARIIHKMCIFEKASGIITEFLNDDPDSGAIIETFNIGYNECIAVDENQNVWSFSWNNLEIPIIRKMVIPYFFKIKKIIFSESDTSSIFLLENDILVFNKYSGKKNYGIISEQSRELNVRRVLNKIDYYDFIFNARQINKVSEKITSIDYSIIDMLMKITFLGKTNIFIMKYIMVSLFENTNSFIKLLNILIGGYLEKLQ